MALRLFSVCYRDNNEVHADPESRGKPPRIVAPAQHSAPCAFARIWRRDKQCRNRQAQAGQICRGGTHVSVLGGTHIHICVGSRLHAICQKAVLELLVTNRAQVIDINCAVMCGLVDQVVEVALIDIIVRTVQIFVRYGEISARRARLAFPQAPPLLLELCQLPSTIHGWQCPGTVLSGSITFLEAGGAAESTPRPAFSECREAAR